jgi:hypothetical protein
MHAELRPGNAGPSAVSLGLARPPFPLPIRAASGRKNNNVHFFRWRPVAARRDGLAYAGGFGERVQTRRDVDAVAVQVVAVDDHVAHVHADAKFHRPFVPEVGVPVGQKALELGSAQDGLDGAGELGDDGIAGAAENAAVMLRDAAVDDAAARFQGGQGALLVRPHQPAEADGVGNQDRRQLPLDAAHRTAVLSARARLSPATSAAGNATRRMWALRCAMGAVRSRTRSAKNLCGAAERDYRPRMSHATPRADKLALQALTVRDRGRGGQPAFATACGRGAAGPTVAR